MDLSPTPTSTVTLTIQPLPDSEFVQGNPSIFSHNDGYVEAAVRGIVEVCGGQQGIQFGSLQVDLKKIETFPGGEPANTSTENIGSYIIDIGKVTEIPFTEDYPFSIRIPDSVLLGIGSGEARVKYELIAQLPMVDESGDFHLYISPAVSISSAVADEPSFQQDQTMNFQLEIEHINQKHAMFFVLRTRAHYSPGEDISVIAVVEAKISHVVTLHRLELMLSESVFFRTGLNMTYGTVSLPMGTLVEHGLPVDVLLQEGQQYRAELSVTIPSNSTFITQDNATHLHIAYTLTVRALTADDSWLTIDLPVTITKCPKDESIQAVRDQAPVLDGILPSETSKQTDESKSSTSPVLPPLVQPTSLSLNSGLTSAQSTIEEMTDVPIGIPGYIQARFGQIGLQPPLNEVERWFRVQHDERYFHNKFFHNKLGFWSQPHLPHNRELRDQIYTYRNARENDDESYHTSAQGNTDLDDATRFVKVLLNGLDMSTTLTRMETGKRGTLKLPYFESNGDLILYEENFLDEASSFWRTRPRWARRTGFRVKIESLFQPQPLSPLATDIGFRFMEYKSPRKPFRLPRLPPEILILILEEVLQGGVPLTIISSVPLLEKSRIALFHQVWRTSSINARDTPKYASLIAEYTARMTLHIGKAFSPGWEQRIISLLVGFKRKGKGRKKSISISMGIDLAGILPLRRHLRCRSIFARCPRSLPSSCLQHLRELALKNYRFQCFSDLMHLIWEIPSLQKLDCRNLSWDEFRVKQPPSPRRQLSDTFVVTAQGSAEAASLVLLLTSVFRIPLGKTSGVLTEYQALVLVALLRSLSSAKASEEEMFMDWSFHRKLNAKPSFAPLKSSIPLTLGKGRLCEVRNNFVSDLHSLRFMLDQDSTWNVHDLRLLTIELVLYSVGMSVDWLKFDKYTSSLLRDHTQKLAMIFVDVDVDISNVQPGDGNMMKERVASCLPKLWTSHQIELKRGDMRRGYIIGNGPSNVQPYE